MKDKQNNDEMPKAYIPSEHEDFWYDFWMKNNFFKANPNTTKQPYSIVIPPPNVTGILTLGHVLNNTLQDILIRWRRMQGYETCWFPGTDHAGIATESKVDKYLRETEGKGKESFSRDEFIARVWKWKEEYGGTIIKQLRKLGASCDWEKERFTLDEGLSRAVREVFVRLYNKGYIYKGKRMINWCPVSKTALSDEEVVYKEVNGKFYHFRYPITDSDDYIIIATTRPETMLGDTAVAVHPDDARYKSLIGKTVSLPLTDRKIPIIADEHADPEFGTGCVKVTPAHDPNDFEIGLRHNLQFINIFNPDATMNENVPEDFRGLDRFECRDKVVEKLEQLGLVEKIEDYRHTVGFSERGDVPVEPMISEQWFVKMEELAKPAIEAVKSGKIKFHPERWIKTYFHWMENIKDWCISRQIWWGHRIPAWYHKETGKVYVGMTAPEDKENWIQEEDVLDTWFSSWLWPFSIMGWPEKTPELGYFYPTNDLVTGPDIIFFWVARMIMAGLEFQGEIPFRNVYFTSIIRDEIGRKLSKSLGNSPDPLEVIKEYGADALRFSIIYIAPIGQDIRYSNEKCALGRNFANKLWNASRYRKIQGEFLGFDFEKDKLTADDYWILGRLNEIINSINNSLENFKFHEAVHSLYDFIWGEFCDWYIETSKENFKNPEIKQNTLKVFDFVWFSILRILHPFMPFITEALAHNLNYLKENETIMFAKYPDGETVPKELINSEIISKVKLKFMVISAGRNLRADYNIPPGKKVKFLFKPADETVRKFIDTQIPSLLKLLKAEALVTDEEPPANSPAPSVVTDAGTIYLPLEGIIDVEKEKQKLTKQKNEIQKRLEIAHKKLTNERFIFKAPKHVVEQEKRRARELEDKLDQIDKLLQQVITH